jgi:hypothetical protein
VRFVGATHEFEEDAESMAAICGGSDGGCGFSRSQRARCVAGFEVGTGALLPDDGLDFSGGVTGNSVDMAVSQDGPRP